MSKQYPGGIVSKTPVVPTSLSAPGMWTLNQQAAAQATNTWPFPRDPQFKNVTMLLHGDGSAGPVAATGVGAGVSTTVTNFNADASTNNFNVTINGDTKSNNFTPYQAGYYSNYFDGTTDYLNTPSNAAFGMGTGDFTVETWIYFTAAQAEKHITDSGTASGLFLKTNATNIGIGRATVGEDTMFNYSFSQNVWYHIAFARSGSTVYGFINGVQIGSATNTNSYATGACYVGAASDGSRSVNGYISNLRIVKGTAVYTSAFTPSTTPLTAITNTSLLTCQSNRFIDNSTNAFTLTVTGNTAVSPAQPFTLPSSVATYGSGYFDGTGDYLTAPSNSAFAFGTGDFTVECWAYFTSVANFPTLTDSRATTSSTAGFNLGLSTAKVQLYTTSQVLIGSTTLVANTWYHIAVTRSGTTLKIWLNGVQDATVSNSTNWSDTTLLLGATPTPTNYMTGYMTDTRLVKGTALYSTTFTPPTSPLTAITNTSLLTTQYNGGGNNSGFKDSSQNNFPITRNGNTTQGTFTPYGSNWSTSFNGSSDYLTTPQTTSLNIGTGTFTVEAFVYLNSKYSSGGTSIINLGNGANGGGPYTGWGLIIDYDAGSSTAYPAWYRYDGSVTQYTSSTSLNIGQWYHLAVARDSSNNIAIWVNGTRVFSGTSTVTYNNVNSDPLNIGRRTNGSANSPNWMNGYISNGRVVIGSNVYDPTQTTITVPTAPLTAVTNTQLLVLQSNRFVDNSSAARTMTVAGGSPSVQCFSPFAPLTVYNPTTYGGSGYFDGNDSLSIPNVPASGTGSFCFEAWIYPTNSSVNQMIIGAVNGGMWVGMNIDTANNFSIGRAFTANDNGVSFTWANNRWYHVAVNRNGTSLQFFVNGVQVGSTLTNSINYSVAGRLIGAEGTTPATFYSGYIAGLRVVNASVYTTAFTPPTLPPSVIANTTLLTNFTNPAILDNAMMNNLETVGNAQISTSVKKYGAASIYLDGSGDYLYSIANQTNNFGTGNFTIECWVYFASVGNAQLVSAGSGSNTNAYYWQYFSSQLQFGVQNVGNITATSWTPSASTWYHIAVVRSGTNVYQFVNGTQLGTTATSSQNFVDGPTYVGFGGAGYLNGYIDDLRITKAARYTTTFTVPDQAFPNG